MNALANRKQNLLLCRRKGFILTSQTHGEAIQEKKGGDQRGFHESSQENRARIITGIMAETRLGFGSDADFGRCTGLSASVARGIHLG